MPTLACPHCRHEHPLADGVKPMPWCRRCGGDLHGVPVGGKRAEEELVALTAAPAAAGGRWGKQTPRPRPAPPERPASPRTTDATPPPAGGRWTNRRPKPVSGWTAEMEQSVEAQVAREMELRPAAFECYIFVVACALVPVASLGGGLWFALGFGGATTCAKLAHSHTLARPVKFLACLGVAVGVWGLFVLMLVVAVRLAPVK